MGSALSQLREGVRRRMGVPPNDALIDSATIDEAVNVAVATLDGERLWPWLEASDPVAVVAGTRSYELPADHRMTRTVLSPWGELAPLAPADIPVADSPGTPGGYTVFAGRLVLDATPTAAGTLAHLYYRRNPPLVEDRDETLAPADAFPAIVAAACSWLASGRDGDTTSAQSHEAAYQRGLTRLIENIRPVSRPTRVRVRPGGWL